MIAETVAHLHAAMRFDFRLLAVDLFICTAIIVFAIWANRQ